MPCGHGSYRIPNCRIRFDHAIDESSRREQEGEFPIANSPILLICKGLGLERRGLDPSSDHADESVVDWQTQGLDGLPRRPRSELLVGRFEVNALPSGTFLQGERGTSDGAVGAQQMNVANVTVRNDLRRKRLRAGVGVDWNRSDR